MATDVSEFSRQAFECGRGRTDYQCGDRLIWQTVILTTTTQDLELFVQQSKGNNFSNAQHESFISGAKVLGLVR